jgi:hypothetical protein
MFRKCSRTDQFSFLVSGSVRTGCHVGAKSNCIFTRVR